MVSTTGIASVFGFIGSSRLRCSNSRSTPSRRSLSGPTSSVWRGRLAQEDAPQQPPSDAVLLACNTAETLLSAQPGADLWCAWMPDGDTLDTGDRQTRQG